MDISPKGLALIKAFEGCFLESYLCPAKVWTIGYGHIDGVEKGQTITKEQADAYLIKDVVWAENVVERHTQGIPLNQHQFDTLTSFVFNVGEGAFKSSTLLKELSKGRYDRIPGQLMRWTKAGKPKKTLKGLVRRRAAEAALWQEIPPPPAPTPDETAAEPMPQAVECAAPPMKELATSGTIWAAAAGGIAKAGEWMLSTATEVNSQTQQSLDATTALRNALGVNVATIGTILVLGCLGVVIARRVAAHRQGKIG